MSIGSGDHVPVTPSLDTSGKTSTFPVTQYGPSCIKVGVITGLTTTESTIFKTVEHEPSEMFVRVITKFVFEEVMIMVEIPPVKVVV